MITLFRIKKHKMTGKERIIKISNQRFFVTNDYSLELNQTNLPNSIGFKDNLKIYWKIEITKFDKTSKELQARVTDYSSKEIECFLKQQKKYEIEKITFEKLEWKFLEPLLYMYQKSALENLIIDNKLISNYEIEEIPDIKKLKPINNDFPKNIYENINEKYDLKQEIKYIPQSKIIKEFIELCFTDITINFGCLTFKKLIYELNEEIEFSIKNEYFEPNFDYIKYHFPKLLKTEIITLNIEIEIQDRKIISKKANSQGNVIEKINKEFIDNIKYQRTIELIKNPKIEQPDKTLYTSDDIFNEFGNNEFGNVFRQSENEILNIILNRTNVRNKKQLEYLSGKLQSESEIIRFTLKSKKNNFGFLFYVDKGETKHHFIWELLNSHATYIWSIEKNEKNLNKLFQQINNTINMIKTIGRDEYKSEYKNRIIDQDIDFDLIRHEKADSDFIDHFPNWRKRLDEKII
jgi:hypothetical protein